MGPGVEMELVEELGAGVAETSSTNVYRFRVRTVE